MGSVVGLAWTTAPAMILGITLLTVLVGVLPMVQLWLARAILDRITAPLGLPVPDGSLALAAPVGLWIGLAVAMLVVSGLSEPVTRTLEAIVGDRLTGRLTERLIRSSNRWRGLSRFEDPAFADDLRLARERAHRIGIELISYGTAALGTLAAGLSLVLVLAALHPLVPVAMVAASVPLMLRTWDFGRKTGALLYWKVPQARKLEYLRNAVLDPSMARDIRLYGLAPWFARAYDAQEALVRTTVDTARRRLVPGMTLASALAAGSAAAVYVWVVVEVAGGRRTVGDVALYGGAATLLQAQLTRIGELFGYLPQALGHLPSYGRIIDAGPDVAVPADPVPVPVPFREGVAFEDVTFTYPGAAEPTLRGVSFTIPAGGSVALVGLNGSGKTTIVKLLLRLYDPDRGRIAIDGTDLRALDLDAFRRVVAVTFQDYVRYNLSAADNIAVGDLAARDDPDRLMAAARLSGADTVIAGLPDGLATVLGREFGDRDLSEGQWQRVALARAFVRDAQLLILDEPTAALDIQTEHDVYTRFAELTRDRTTLLISHRLSAVRLADRILFLDGGRITESGSHAELMAAEGAYARLYRLQAGHYGIDADVPADAEPVAAGTTEGAR